MIIEVRLAAVKSMESLSARNKEFGSQCLDHLIDMFNDEIEEVRYVGVGEGVVQMCSFMCVSLCTVCMKYV